MAFIRNPGRSFPEYKSAETATAFLQSFWFPTQLPFGLDGDSESDDADMDLDSDIASDLEADV